MDRCPVNASDAALSTCNGGPHEQLEQIRQWRVPGCLSCKAPLPRTPSMQAHAEASTVGTCESNYYSNCFLLSFVFSPTVRLLPLLQQSRLCFNRAEEGASDAWITPRLDLTSNAPIEPQHVANACGKRCPICAGGQEDVHEIGPAQPALAIPESR